MAAAGVSRDAALPMTIAAATRYVAQANSSAAALQGDGNTYMNMYEATSMNSGLTVVVLINVFVAGLGLLFYRYIILREAGLLTEEEIELLRKYPDNLHAYTYTPSDSFVRAPPPVRWTGWTDFLRGDDRVLSRDAQVYLLFQRACILTTMACGLFASIVLLPWYWFGGELFQVGHGATNSDGQKPLTLLNMLKSDRGVFERFTSHNLPSASPLVLLQFPVMAVVAFCVVFLYSVVKTAAGQSRRTTAEWLQHPSTPRAGEPTISQSFTHDVQARSASHYVTSPDASPTASPTRRRNRDEWTLFVRGLPLDIRSSTELAKMLSVIYPSQVARVELVCKGRSSEVKMMRELESAKYRYEYFLGLDNNDEVTHRFVSRTLFGGLFGLFVRRYSREEILEKLRHQITDLEKKLNSRKSQPVRGFRGCAFISFTSSRAAEIALKHGANHVHDSLVSPSSSSGSSESYETIPRTRESLQFGIPTLRNLYLGVVNILPEAIRNWVLSTPSLSPSMDSFVNENVVFASNRDSYRARQYVAMRLRKMKAKRAPKSADIVWENIGISFMERTIREILVQILVFAILILFTSPIAMLTAGKLFVSEIALLTDPQVLAKHNATGNVTGNPLLPTIDVKNSNAALGIASYIMERLPNALSNNEWLRSTIFTYVPVLMLACVFAAVPSLLRITCVWEGYMTKSAQELSVFRKTAFYYVMNAVVLPSVALNTMSEFLEVLYQKSNGGADISSALPILTRLFSGDIAFFLCNYLVQLALTGSVFWLMRIPSSFSMMIRRRMALTPLENAEAKCTDVFDYPRHYAYCVTVISMCLLFGCMAPLLWWFAFFYFIIKHSVDVYCIRYVHPRTHIDGRLPRNSISFVLVWTVVSQLSIAVMFYSQNWVKACIACVFLCALTMAACLSAGHDVGNRVLIVIATARSELVRRLVGDGSTMFGWAVGTSMQDLNSSALGSIDEEPQETSALLEAGFYKDPELTDEGDIGAAGWKTSGEIRNSLILPRLARNHRYQHVVEQLSD